jgi:hypothetical protein
MQTYTVHEPPGGPTDRMERAERLVFVKDGFSLVAALFAPFWMLAHRLWLALLIYLGALAGIELIVWALDLTQQVAGWITLGLHILVGLESDAIRRWTLARGGYRQIASVTGRGWNECERRFFDAWLAEQPFVAPTPREGGRSGAGRLSPLALGPGR